MFSPLQSLSLAPSKSPITQYHLDAAMDALSVMSQTMKCCLPNLNALLPNFGLPNLNALLPYFGWVGKECIHDTLDKTTQHYKADQWVPMHKHFHSRFPAANICHLPEWYSMDTFIPDVPAFDDGMPGHSSCKLLQVYNRK